MKTDKISPDTVSALSTTMLIPLWAKAVEFDQKQPLLRDAEAVRMIGMIDYDFSRFAKSKASQVGCCGRAALLDDMANRFIAEYPDAVIVDLGAGLDARFERLGKPPITAWYDLDLPEVIELRRMLLSETSNHYLAASLFDESWMEMVAEYNKPVLLIIEGVLMYFQPEQVKDWFALLARKLPNAEIIFDTLPKIAIGRQKKHDALKHIEKPPEFKWGINHIEDLNQLGLTILENVELSSICGQRYPLILRLLYLTKCGRKKLDIQIVRAKICSNE
ncbi:MULTISPECIES: class I SAM-dependent methyltransferase [unclassified Lonepinella]|uniref:class I SAM-dependent methyltransferase n=1 Tax=unclassified Lonepinella TaxID=2642006 RepID=UPI0036DA5B13